MLNRFFKGAALALSLALPTAAFAGGCATDIDHQRQRVVFVENGNTYKINFITNFAAYLTQRDLRNSRGTRLTSAGAVLQQYVANRVKSGQSVTDNNFFHSLERRTLLSTGQLYTYCGDSIQEVRNNIVNARVQGAALAVFAFRHPNGGIVFLVAAVG